MKQVIITILLFSLIMTGCTEYTTISVRTKKDKQKARPPVTLLERIIDFRTEFHSWPQSKQDFLSKGPKYQSAFDGFPFQQVQFASKDSTKMVFRYWDHPADVANYKQSGKVDLNSYSGFIKFYQKGNRFYYK